LIAHVTAFPANICFLIGIAGMVIMIVFAKKLDSSDVKQGTNAIAQFSFY